MIGAEIGLGAGRSRRVERQLHVRKLAMKNRQVVWRCQCRGHHPGRRPARTRGPGPGNTRKFEQSLAFVRRTQPGVAQPVEETPPPRLASGRRAEKALEADDRTPVVHEVERHAHAVNFVGQSIEQKRRRCTIAGPADGLEKRRQLTTGKILDVHSNWMLLSTEHHAQMAYRAASFDDGEAAFKGGPSRSGHAPA
jgi:hypothetical protein